MRLADLQFESVGERRRSRSCEFSGCGEKTREGKPYCLGHVEEHPHVQRLLLQLAEREAQDERVREYGAAAVDLGSVTVHEILLHLELHGPRTEERLVRELTVDLRALSGYLVALAAAGRISLGSTARGSRLAKPVSRSVADQRVSA